MKILSLNFLKTPASADDTADNFVRDVVGKKSDTANTTVGTTSSLMRYIKGVIGLHSVPAVDSADNLTARDILGNKTDSIKGTSVMSFFKRSVPSIVAKTNVCNGNGAQTDNLFVVTGYVELVRIWAECTQVTNGTVLSGNYLDLYDGSASVELTDNGAPLDLSGALEAGEIIIKNGASATAALTVLHNAAGAVTDTAISTGTTLTQKASTNTYIRHCFTGNADTNVSLIWYVEYKPLSTNGAITMYS